MCAILKLYTLSVNNFKYRASLDDWTKRPYGIAHKAHLEGLTSGFLICLTIFGILSILLKGKSNHSQPITISCNVIFNMADLPFKYNDTHQQAWCKHLDHYLYHIDLTHHQAYNISSFHGSCYL